MKRRVIAQDPEKARDFCEGDDATVDQGTIRRDGDG
jgi:hypothetical protein